MILKNCWKNSIRLTRAKQIITIAGIIIHLYIMFYLPSSAFKCEYSFRSSNLSNNYTDDNNKSINIILFIISFDN